MHCRVSAGVTTLLGLAVLAGCMATAEPRFPTEVAAGVRVKPMRRLETPDIAVYYPQDRRDEAQRFASWVGGCVRDLQRLTLLGGSMAARKPFVVMPEPALDNAFVLPPTLGAETASVVTSHSTFDFLVDIGMAPDPALFGCHEMVHWTHIMQVAGFWGTIDEVLGDVLSPQMGLDSWFHEGLATVYESRLQRGIGRMASPYWEGAFHAGVAGRRITGGDLSVGNRAFVFGNNYIIGSRFLDYLRRRYGEEKLWELVRTQGTAIFFPFWVSLRFWQVYDKNLSTLIDEFADETAQSYPVVPTPPEQRRVHQLGYAARYAVARNGTEAVVSEDFDQPIRLAVYAPDGRVLRRRALTEVIPVRTLVEPTATYVSGLSLTADGDSVYFVVIDPGATFLHAHLVHYRVATDRMDVVADDVDGPGGDVSSDGRAYLFAHAAGDRHEIREIDLATSQIRTVVTAEAGVFLGSPRLSPDGARVVATVASGSAVRLGIFERATGRALGAPVDTGARVAVDPWFVDDHRVLFSAATAGRFQLFVVDVATGRPQMVSHAPYVALGGRPLPAGRVRFLNREGWRWTLDEVRLPTAVEAQATPGGPTRAQPNEDAPAAPMALSEAVIEEAEAPATPAPDARDTTAASPDAGAPSAPRVDVPPPPAPSLFTPVAPARAAILSDEPYSAFDHLFVPQLRTLTLASLPDEGHIVYGASLGGGDRLGLHRWALTGFVDTVKGSARFDGSVAYANSQLAPLTLRIAASRWSWWDKPYFAAASTNPATLTVDRHETDLALDLLLPFYTHSARLGFISIDERRVGDPDLVDRQRLGGLTAALTLSAAETTPYTGARRALALQLGGAFYPEQLSSEPFTFGDLSAALHGVVPVPPSSRLTFALDLRGRALPGTPRGAGFLQVGGLSTLLGTTPMAAGPEPTTNDTALDPLPVQFAEGLRGYEDLALYVDRIAIADARFTYPLIIDGGFASTFVLLPSTFFRQVDVETFGTAAWDTRTQRLDALHAASGGALTLRLLFAQAPLAIRYQVARRLADDKIWTQTVSVGN